MADDTNLSTVRVVTAHDQIRALADSHDAEPRVVERPDAADELRVESAPDGAGDAVSWGEFFERFDGADRRVVYRPAEPASRENPILDVVDPAAVGIPPADAAPGEPGDDTETLATSDTGDSEPVAYDTGGRADSDRGDEDDREEAPVAPTADAERAPTDAAEGLVLDEIHGAQPGTGRGVDDEYLVFENDGDQRLDLSGWTVHNDEGRSYRFPEGTALAPGEQVTLHSGRGDDDEHHRYWNADEPVWGDQRDTVTVETPAGERVVRVSYEA